MKDDADNSILSLHKVKNGEFMFLNTIEPYEKYKVVAADELKIFFM